MSFLRGYFAQLASPDDAFLEPDSKRWKAQLYSIMIGRIGPQKVAIGSPVVWLCLLHATVEAAMWMIAAAAWAGAGVVAAAHTDRRSPGPTATHAPPPTPWQYITAPPPHLQSQDHLTRLIHDQQGQLVSKYLNIDYNDTVEGSVLM